jgi:hypothetical protein
VPELNWLIGSFNRECRLHKSPGKKVLKGFDCLTAARIKIQDSIILSLACEVLKEDWQITI